VDPTYGRIGDRPSAPAPRFQSFWLALLGLVIALLWLLQDAVLPFMVAFALSYLLDPPVRWMEKFRVRRWIAVSLMVGAVVLVALVALFTVIPQLAGQLASLLERLPAYAARLQQIIGENVSRWVQKFGGWEQLGLKPPGDEFSSAAGDVIGPAVSWGVGFMRSVASGGGTIISVLSLFVVSPIVAFYLLLDWDRMLNAVDGWLPRAHREEIRGVARDVNRAVAASLRGQALVSLFLALWYGIGLQLAGLNFGLLIGLSAGVLSVIPYVGSFVGLGVACLVAIVQFWPEWQAIGLVLLVFVSGQLLEGYVLTPKLIGEAIGLHPVWMMFSLFAFGALFGFVGLLLAVPMSAIAAVLARHALQTYLASPYYHDEGSASVPPGSSHDL